MKAHTLSAGGSEVGVMRNEASTQAHAARNHSAMGLVMTLKFLKGFDDQIAAADVMGDLLKRLLPNGQ